jgi:hypothetical protein
VVMTAATAKLAAMTTKNPAAAHPSPGFGGSEAEAGEMSPAASSAAKQANTSATAVTPTQAPKEIPACVNGP